ncbi:hypothetical protein IQ268_20575 [Oculatella sp. LEGE 06141]|nr:hypothetical protein [Oculatella sp. LEGE 06141]
MSAFFRALYWCIQLIQPVLVPLCFLVAWTLVLTALWSVWSAVRDGLAKAKQMHSIPCAGCQYFTRDYHLKCPVHPMKALSEEAIGCLDYQSAPGYSVSRQMDSFT